MSFWAEFPINLFTRVLNECETSDIRSLRLVCSSWRGAVDKSLHHLKPKQFKDQLINRFPGVQYLNLNDSVPKTDDNQLDVSCLGLCVGLRGLNIRYSQSRGFYGKAFQIEGIQAEVLAKLTNLQYLDISGQDDLCWAQLHFLSELQQLQSLFLENMSRGGFDQNCWNSIAKITGLKQLEIGGANARRPLHLNLINNLQQLQILGIGNMSWTHTTKGLSELQSFGQLIKLDASNCKIQQEIDVEQISKAVNLQTVLLRGNELRDPQLQPLANLPRLTHLSLGGTQVCGDVLSFLSALTYLDISNCAHLDSVPIISYLSSNTSLIELHMMNCTVQVPLEMNEQNEPPVAHMLQQGPIQHPVKPPLKLMDLSGTMRAPYIMWRTLLVEGIQLETLLMGKSSDAVDAFVSFLQYQKQLKILNLASCLTTHRCLTAVARMPQLEQLNVDFCALDTDNLIYSLIDCTDFQSLEMQKGKNINNGLKLISMNFGTTLLKLNLSHCSHDFTDLGMADIATLSNLTELRMSYCKKISDIGFFQMGKALTKLKILDLEGCKISDLGFQNFDCFRKLEMLEIGHCEMLSGQIIPIICKMNRLKSLYMENMEQIFEKDLKLLGSCQSLTQLVVGRVLPNGFFPLWINVR